MLQKSRAMRLLAAMTARISLSVGTGVRGRSGVRDPVDELEVEQSEESDMAELEVGVWSWLERETRGGVAQETGIARERAVEKEDGVVDEVREAEGLAS